MGGGRQDKTTSQEQTKSVTATPEETRLNQLDLELRESTQGQLLDVNKLALTLAGDLLSGGGLPGNLSKLPGGISEEVTKDIVDQSFGDISTSAQFSGLGDSGTALELAQRSSADIRTQSEQFNLQNLIQLLNIAIGGGTSLQGPSIGFGASVGSRLAGLRGETNYTKGKTTTTDWGGGVKLFGATSAGSGIS